MFYKLLRSFQGSRYFSCRSKITSRQGFTLIELLVVIGVIVIVSTLGVPAIESISTAGNFESNVSEMSSLLEQAYSAALARNTYVWVGFTQLTSGGVEMAFVYTAHGSSLDLPSNVSTLSKPVFLPSLNLTTISSQQVSTAARATESVVQITNADCPTFSAQIGGVSQTLKMVLEITPSGQVLISPENKYAWIEMGLAPLHGNQSNVAVLQMNTFTGRISTFMP